MTDKAFHSTADDVIREKREQKLTGNTFWTNWIFSIEKGVKSSLKRYIEQWDTTSTPDTYPVTRAIVVCKQGEINCSLRGWKINNTRFKFRVLLDK